MKHNIRQHITDPIVGKRVKVETVYGELGSDILDKNGKEIFEGDKIKIGVSAVEVVEFDDGHFSTDTSFEDLCNFDSNDLEIVGHVGD